MKTKGLGIWFKLATGLFFFSVLPMAILGVNLYRSGKSDIIASSGRDLYSLVQILETKVDEYIMHVVEDTEVLARTPFFVERANSLYERPTALVRVEAQALMAAQISYKTEARANFLLHPDTGEVLASNDPYQIGKFFNRKKYFIKGREHTVLSRVHYSPAIEANILAIATPVHHEGKLVGVLVSWVNFQAMSRVLDIKGEDHISLVSRANLHVFGTSGSPDRVSLQSGAFTDGAVKALAGESGYAIYKDAEGRDVIGGYALIKQLDLALIIERPIEQVLENVGALSRQIEIYLVILGALALGAALLAGRAFSSPLIRMAKAAREIAGGDFSQRVDYVSGDELGLLSESMNTMARNLEVRRAELEGMVATMNSLIEHIPEGVVLLDKAHRVALANPIGESCLMELEGIKKGEKLLSLGGRSMESLLVSPPQLLWHEITTNGGDRSSTFEVATRRIFEGDAVSGMVLVIKDVTGEREAQRNLQAQEKLAAVGQLASGIAHDFSNILTSVIGFSEMLLTDGGLPEHVMAQIGAIQQSGLRAADLIGQILDFSRRSHSEMKTLDIRVSLKEFIRFIDRIIPENITIKVDAAEGEYPVRADLTKFQQVLANLSVNARDSMEKGGVLAFRLYRAEFSGAVRPPLHDMPSDSRWVVLEVADTGGGIPPEVLPHVFEPFYTTKGAGKGTGLGLAQVYGIVKQHGGYIELASTVGQGTKFTLYLPESMEAAHKHTDASLRPIEKGEGQMVLVVEDDPAVIGLLLKALEAMGYRTMSAGNGEDGLNVFMENMQKIDLVITDIMMPRMDGREMAARIRELSPEAKIVAVTGYQAGEQAEGEISLFDDTIKKPFQVEKLSRTIRAVLYS